MPSLMYFGGKEMVEKKAKTLTEDKSYNISYVKLDLIVCSKALFILYFDENFVTTYFSGERGKESKLVLSAAIILGFATEH